MSILFSPNWATSAEPARGSLSGMAVEGLQNYIQLLNGMSKATRTKAVAAAKSVLGQTGLEKPAADATERVSKVADELLAASRANRKLLEKLINTEVDKAAARLGFARAADLQALRTEIAELRRTVEDQARPKPGGIKVSPAAEPPRSTSAARKAAAKKAAAKKAATTASAKAATTASASQSVDDAEPSSTAP